MNDLIMSVINEEVRKAWEELQNDIEVFGVYHKYTTISRARWYYVNKVLEEVKEAIENEKRRKFDVYGL